MKVDGCPHIEIAFQDSLLMVSESNFGGNDAGK